MKSPNFGLLTVYPRQFQQAIIGPWEGFRRCAPCFPAEKRTKSIHYNSAGAIDTIRIVDPANANKLLNLFSYKYGSDTIKQYIHSADIKNPVVDSIIYVYDDQENLFSWRINPSYGRPLIISYPQYDDCFNIYRYLNINVYLPLADRNVNPPFLSKNNHLMREEHNYIIRDIGPATLLYRVNYREYTTNPSGLIISALEKSPNGGITRFTYEYISSK